MGSPGVVEAVGTLQDAALRQSPVSSLGSPAEELKGRIPGKAAPDKFGPQARTPGTIDLEGAVGTVLGLGVPGVGPILAGSAAGGGASTTRSASTSQGEAFLSHRVSGLAGSAKVVQEARDGGVEGGAGS